METFKAIDELRRQLDLPIASEDDIVTIDNFDPWEAFPCFYGSYSSEFDDTAILVLENIRDNTFRDEGLAHEMFREVLCTSGLCDYGTSPRVCFPDWGSGFAEILPALIDKWKAYRVAQWGAP